MSGPVKPVKRSPESAAWDRLKGMPVTIIWLHPGEGAGKGLLRWVDRYTIGLEVGGREHLVFKQAIRFITADPH